MLIFASIILNGNALKFKSCIVRSGFKHNQALVIFLGLFLGKKMKRIKIVAGIIFNAEQDKIFITKRGDHQDQGGFWEFPGGKVELGEESSAALIRELDEEVGIQVSELELFDSFDYDYPNKSLSFEFFSVTKFAGTPFGKEGQIGEWVALEDLTKYEFPSANVPVMQKLVPAKL